MIFVSEEAAKVTLKPVGKIPEGYVLETIYSEKGKSIEAWHDPKSKEQTAWIFHEVGTKW